MSVAASDLPLPLGVSVSDPQVVAALGVVETFCGWSLQTSTQTVTLDSDGGAVLVLPSLLVTDVASVVLNGVDQWGNPFVPPVLGSNWDWRENGVLTWLSAYGWPSGWPVGGRRVSVTYTDGFDSLPDGVLAVVSSVAQRASVPSQVQAHTENVGGIQTSTTYAQSVTAGAGLTAIEQAVLNRWRIETVS